MTRPAVKVCGITRYEDAVLALESGADILGFVFAPSPRRVDAPAVRAILHRLRDGGLLEGRTTVGVFVNEETAAMAEALAMTGLDFAQVHGDEEPGACAAFGFPWYRALRLRDGGDASRLAGKGGETWGCPRLLFDAAVAGAYGGTGKRIGQEAALEARRISRLGGKEFFLAGGISPDNVGRIVREIRPDGIDVGSGVEEVPGRKSREALRALFANLERAVAGVGAEVGGGEGADDGPA